MIAEILLTLLALCFMMYTGFAAQCHVQKDRAGHRFYGMVAFVTGVVLLIANLCYWGVV